MSANFFLDWTLLAVSLFNTVLLTWLGLTVLLNSDRRSWGIWLAGGGLLLGSMFFISHTAIIGLGLEPLSKWSMVFWWTIGLVPAIALPFAWYLVMLWYAGFRDNRQSSLWQRQRFWFLITVFLLVAGFVGLAVGIILLLIPLPSLAQLRLFVRWSIAGIPLMALGYSCYVVLCISLSLDALRRPGPPTRIMGALARLRARPWLIAASMAQLIVSLLVAGVMLWIVQDARRRTFLEIYTDSAVTIAWLDLIISSIIGIAIILLGQAVASYEVFTGKTLPRRGLLRHWRLALILAAGYSVLASGSIVIHLRPLYSLLLTTMLIPCFYALFSWRSYVERDRYIAYLRPFVSSQRLYDQLLAQAGAIHVDFTTPFHTLCADVLGAQVAYLVALGPLAPLVGRPLVYPGSVREPSTLSSLVEISAQFNSPQTMIVPLDPARCNAVWAIPLWSERGLSGVLLLGEKRDGGLYAQEEIEIARAVGERLIDTQASGEMARRLMSLQRERLAQSQIIDRQTRRVLHDDILPDLQAAMIVLNSQQAGGNSHIAEAMSLLTAAHRQISDLLRDMPTTTAPEVLRLGLVGALQLTVENELAHAFDGVNWQIEPEVEQRIQSIPTLTAEVIFYAAREAIRNAARYGQDANSKRPLCLNVKMTCHEDLELQIEDNGIGLGAPGQTSQGSGQGLALHSTMMAVVGGVLTIDSAPDKYTRVALTLPRGKW